MTPENPRGGGVMPQLELGVLPLTVECRVGMPVAFILKTRKRRVLHKEVRYARIVSVNEDRLVVEDIAAPGSRHNRQKTEIFQVSKDIPLVVFE